MAEPAPLARSPITPLEPVVRDGWEVSGRRSTAPLRLVDCTPLGKVLVRAGRDGAAAAALGVSFGRASRQADGALVVGSGPGEWLALTEPGQAAELVDRLRDLPADGLVSVLDLTHGRALVRLTGADAPAMLAKICAIDLSDRVTPDGTAFRSSVAKVAADVVRDDQAGEPSYLLHVERSSGQYFFDALLDAGAEFGIAVDGFPGRTN